MLVEFANGSKSSVEKKYFSEKKSVTATNITPSPQQGSTTAQLAAESSKIEGLVQGSAAVSAPSTVKSGDPFQVFLRVSPGKLDQLMLSLTSDYPENKTVKGRQGVKLTPRMKASVSGIGFKVTAADDAIQAISSSDDTTWTWQVVAEEPGRRTLTFSLAGTLNVEGNEVARNFYQYNQKVQVEVNQLSFLDCLVSCDHIPRRSMALFRAKALLDELIAGFPPRSSHRLQQIA